jgi:SAM-dependent methyltransferase
LSAFKVGRYARAESNFEHEVIEAVIETNYRRLIDGRSVDISVGGIHNLVVGNDVDRVYQEPVSLENLSGILVDATDVKQYKGRKGELRAVVGATTAGRVKPVGMFINTEGSDIERTFKGRIKQAAPYNMPFNDASFDFVSCCDVLEHVDETNKTISEISRVLKPDGLFF